jgi:hypothetical protein
MWQITWMLSFLPDWFWTAVFISGILAVIAAWLLKRIPFVSRYQSIFKVGGIIAILIGTWFLGAASNEERHKAEVESMQKKIEEATAQAALTNRAIETKIEVQTKVIREKSKDIVKTAYLNQTEIIESNPKKYKTRVNKCNLMSYLETEKQIPKKVILNSYAEIKQALGEFNGYR